jgi:hypothetical protein
MTSQTLPDFPAVFDYNTNDCEPFSGFWDGSTAYPRIGFGVWAPNLGAKPSYFLFLPTILYGFVQE